MFLLYLQVNTDSQSGLARGLAFSLIHYHMYFILTSHSSQTPFTIQCALYSLKALPLYCDSQFLNSAFLCPGSVSSKITTLYITPMQVTLLLSWRTLIYNVMLTTLTALVNLYWVVLKIVSLELYLMFASNICLFTLYRKLIFFAENHFIPAGPLKSCLEASHILCIVC